MANNNNFKLTLDTIGPDGSVSIDGTYFNNGSAQDALLTISQSGEAGKGGAQHMKIWCDTLPNPTKENSKGYAKAPWEAFATQRAAEFSGDWYEYEGTKPAFPDEIYYYHAVLRDEVGNESDVLSTDVVYFDTTLPEVTRVEFRAAGGDKAISITNSKTVDVYFEYSDNLSKAARYSMTITGKSGEVYEKSGTIPSSGEGLAGSCQIAVELPCQEAEVESETNTVELTIYDNAENASETPATATVVLDTMSLKGNIIAKQGDKIVNDTWTNQQDVTIELDFTNVEVDCAGYKVWGDINLNGGSTGTIEPIEWTKPLTPETDPIIITGMKLTSMHDTEAQATKHIYAKVVDHAGNETVLNGIIVKYDATAPSLAQIESNKAIISKEEGYDTATLTVNGYDALAGLRLHWIVYGKPAAAQEDAWTEVKTGSGSPGIVTITGNDSFLAEGVNQFKVKFTDLAGNSTESSKITVILDTTAPTGSVSVNSWLNAADFESGYNPTFSATDANGAVTKRAWISSVAKDTAVDGTVISGNTLTIKATGGNVSIARAATDASEYYLHVELTDVVGNSTIIHSNKFGIDRAAPIDCSVEFGQAAYSSASATVNLAATDNVSGVASYKISGDIANPSADWEEFGEERAVTLKGEDGNKTVTVIYKDVAGNVSAPVTATCELDTTSPSGSAEYYEADGVTAKPTHSSLDSFKVKIAAVDDQGKTPVGNVYYQIYGDFNAASGKTQKTEYSESGWVKLDTSPIMTSTLYYTANAEQGEEAKEIYVVFKDNAGNIYRLDKVTFYYDTGIPEVNVSNLDHDRLSKLHVLRLYEPDHSAVDHYCDFVQFDFTPSEHIQAYKVVAYADAAAARAGTHEDAYIGNAFESSNMHGEMLNSNATVHCMLNGSDLEVALGGTGSKDTHGEGFDGLHVIVVYVQDLSGQWSAAAEIPA